MEKNTPFLTFDPNFALKKGKFCPKRGGGACRGLLNPPLATHYKMYNVLPVVIFVTMTFAYNVIGILNSDPSDTCVCVTRLHEELVCPFRL